MEILVIHTGTRRSNLNFGLQLERRPIMTGQHSAIAYPHPYSPLLFSRVWERRIPSGYLPIFRLSSSFPIWMDDNLPMLHNFYSYYERENTVSEFWGDIEINWNLFFCESTLISALRSKNVVRKRENPRISPKSPAYLQSRLVFHIRFCRAPALFLTVLPWHLIVSPSCLLLHDVLGLVTQKQCSCEI